MPRGKLRADKENRRSSQKGTRMIELDKHGNVLRDGEKIGRIFCQDSVFIGENFLSQKKVRRFDFDEVAAWLGLKA